EVAAARDQHQRLRSGVAPDALPGQLGRSEAGRLKMGELADQLALSTGGLTRLVDRLIEADLVCRVDDPSDRRVQLVELRPVGLATLEAAVATHLRDLEVEMFSRLDATDVRRLDTILDTLRRPEV
ncbi:MAG: MarR family transcriptional regulator, partial [Actinomycetota bacterium]